MNVGKRDAIDKTGKPSAAWSTLPRVLVSLALLYHVAAILAGVFAAPPASDLQRGAADFFQSYNQSIDQGYSYRYFAPEPPPTPILVAKLFDKDGRELESVRIPERGTTPRLRYQRGLAIATALAIPPRHPDHPGHSERAEPPPPFWAASFARSLGRRNPACVRVRLQQEIHLIPNLGEIRQAIAEGNVPDLDDPRFYTAPELIGDFPCDPSAS